MILGNVLWGIDESGKLPVFTFSGVLTMNSVEKFEQWCVVEIMGHKRFAGLVT